jgi:phosphoribosylglycinamide formyltransferase-1
VDVIDHKQHSSREEFEKEVIRRLEPYRVDLIALAGFMRILSPFFVRAYKNRIMNLHPALLPLFPGIHAAKQALDFGVKFTGCTVHFVDEGVDTGPIILQAVVPIYDDDTEETLLERIHKEEHRIYPEAIRLFAEGKLRIEGRRVFVRE